MRSYLHHTEVTQNLSQFENDKIAFALSLLPEAAQWAVVPVSNFHVGAIAIDEQGNFYFGANQECDQAHIGQTVHAEQSAIAHAWQRGAQRITDIIVNYTPCGHCRQFLNELRGAEELRIHLPHSRDNLLSQYLPDSFSPKDLGMDERLLDDTRIALSEPTHLNEWQHAAFQAAEQSYAPYSKAYAGVAISTGDAMFTGRYAENAAYNPSLPPLQVALNLLRLSGRSTADIQHAALVCTAHGGHVAASQSLWQALNIGCELENMLVNV
ncbi:cytidine deaminase [Neisseriaceae bacterium B1]